MSRALLLGGMALILVAPPGCSGGQKGDPVAVKVNGASIGQSVVSHWIAALSVGRSVPASGPEQEALERQALERLIGFQWLIGKARTLGISVTKGQAERRLEALRQSFSGGPAEFTSYLHTAERTLADMMLVVESEIAAAKLRQILKASGTQATNSEALGYFRTHRQQFIVPEVREIRATDRKTPAESRRVMNEIEHGRPFAQVATRINAWTRRAHLRTNPDGLLEKAIFTARPHVLVGPVKHWIFWWVLRVEHVTPARRIPFENARRGIIEKLDREKNQQATTRLLTEWSKEWRLRTSCAPRFLVAMCRQSADPHPDRTLFEAALRQAAATPYA